MVVESGCCRLPTVTWASATTDSFSKEKPVLQGVRVLAGRAMELPWTQNQGLPRVVSDCGDEQGVRCCAYAPRHLYQWNALGGQVQTQVWG
jgi:hypothetical protein